MNHASACILYISIEIVQDDFIVHDTVWSMQWGRGLSRC